MKATLNTARVQKQRFHMETYRKLYGKPHFHSLIEILWVRHGEVKLWVGNNAHIVRENELAVVLSYEAHQFTSGNGLFTHLFIPTQLCPEFAEGVQHKKLHSPVIREEQTVERILYSIGRLGDGGLNDIEQRGYIQVILGCILRHASFEPADVPQEADLPAKLLLFLGEHYRETLTVEAVASALGYSGHYISEVFRKCFGVGIGEYIHTLRLKNAVMMMRDKKLSIEACARESGFGSLRTFYRAFHREFGCSPREYRE
jgi:AraC-like DNA-binding protein/mannose-6-phosphate isomerase-like protein (cupin superfamily)